MPLQCLYGDQTAALRADPEWSQRRMAETPEELYEALSALPLQSRPPVQIYGRTLRQRRDVGFFSDTPGVPGYRYSGQTMPAQPLRPHPVLRRLLRRVNRELGCQYNAILVNRYRTGADHLGAHRDSLVGLDSTHPVASVCYGAVRTFRIRRADTRQIVYDYPQPPGALVLMDGDFQDLYTHEIPVQRRVAHGRISCTFRRHLVE